MAKNYFNIISIVATLFTINMYSQTGKLVAKVSDNSVIDGLSIYPNPVTNGKVSIITKLDENKEILIFDVLGKKVFQTQITGRDLNISDLVPGVYIIKITEESNTATRKLIVR